MDWKGGCELIVHSGEDGERRLLGEEWSIDERSTSDLDSATKFSLLCENFEAVGNDCKDLDVSVCSPSSYRHA